MDKLIKDTLINENINSLQFALKTLKENIFLNLSVCLPVVVKNYDFEKNLVDVQPSIQAMLNDDTYEDLEPIFSVPVISLGGNGLSMRIDLKEGDTGIIICSDRDITLFMQEYLKENFVSTQPQTTRKHCITDAFFIPSMFGKIKPSDKNGFTVQNADGSSKLQVTQSGVNVVGNMNIDGDLNVTGNIVATGDIKNDGKMEAGNGASGTFVDTGTGASQQSLIIKKGIITEIIGG